MGTRFTGGNTICNVMLVKQFRVSITRIGIICISIHVSEHAIIVDVRIRMMFESLFIMN
ncbi:MAG: hypothetical protein ACTSUN_07585 [Promethearchaeota archaeon]